ncbi:MAG: hypothetical protein K2K91_11685 [Ruminococcus sp.]|nr:hypothetical protein [Ruminococcus sp.]MDE7099539.1 hypothetical protein [Ruminococcus sp.]
MKKISIILMCAVIMTGCTEKTDNSSSEIAESPEITTETVTEQTKIASRKEFVVTENGIQVIRDGEIFQTLEDTNIYKVSGQTGRIDIYPEDYLIKRDFDGDGCMDLFVPYLVSDEEKGVYYHRNPDTAELEKWDTFNEIGVYLTSANAIADTFLRRAQFRRIGDDKLKYFICDSNEDEDIYYSYDKIKDKLEYAGRELTYTNSDGEEYTDTFLKSYTTGEEQLVCRKKGAEEIFVHPSQCYIRTEENKISVIWHKCSEGYDTIQTFEGNYKAHKDTVGHCTPPKNTASFKDMDGDGYNDIVIDEGEFAGDYFRFNPDTFRFDERTESTATENDDISMDNLEIVHSDLNFHGLSEPPYFVRRLENEDIYYQSYNDNLNYMGRIIKYKGDDGLNYADTYFQSGDKGEQLICRRQITGDTEKEIFVHPYQCYIPYKNDVFGVYFRENGELIQTIECNCQFYESTGNCTPEPCFIFKDVDNDGYDDIYIEKGKDAGKYFRFNLETFRFDEV